MLGRCVTAVSHIMHVVNGLYRRQKHSYMIWTVFSLGPTFLYLPSPQSLYLVFHTSFLLPSSISLSFSLIHSSFFRVQTCPSSSSLSSFQPLRLSILFLFRYFFLSSFFLTSSQFSFFFHSYQSFFFSSLLPSSLFCSFFSFFISFYPELAQ